MTLTNISSDIFNLASEVWSSQLLNRERNPSDNEKTKIMVTRIKKLRNYLERAGFHKYAREFQIQTHTRIRTYTSTSLKEGRHSHPLRYHRSNRWEYLKPVPNNYHYIKNTPRQYRSNLNVILTQRLCGLWISVSRPGRVCAELVVCKS